MSFLDFLLAEAISAGLAHAATNERQPPPKNFFVLPDNPTAWKVFKVASEKENMVTTIEFTNNMIGTCRAVQPLFVELARQFESVLFLRVQIAPWNTYEELRRDLGGVQSTPTILIVFFNNDGKKIAKIEGADKIQVAVKSGNAEKIIRAFMEQHMKLKRAEKLAGELAFFMTMGLAAASAKGSAGKSREQQMREKFEKEMEKEVMQPVKHTNELLKKLKAEKVRLDIELDSLQAQLEMKERAIRDLEQNLNTN